MNGKETIESAEKLKSFMDRVQRLEEETANIRNDIKQIYMEAKVAGFDTKAMKKINALMKMEADERAEQDNLIDTYRSAVDI